MKRNNNRNTIKVETNKYIYLVTLERLRNTTCGNPRYNANVIVLLAKDDRERPDQKYYFTYNYTFNGHYCGDEGECEWLCKRIEEEREKQC